MCGCGIDTLGGVPVGSPQTWESVLATGQFTGADAATPGGNDPTISDGDSLFWSDGIENRLEIIRVVDDIELRMRDGAGVLQGTIDLDTATAEVRFPANVTLDSAGPILTLGDGTGSPIRSLNKSAAGVSQVQWRDVGVIRWTNSFEANENLIWIRHDGAGVVIDTPLTLEVATGDVLMANRLGVSGADPDDASTLADDIAIGSTTVAEDRGISILTPSNRDGFIFFADPGSTTAGGLTYDHGSDLFRIRTANADRIFVDPTHMAPNADNGVILGRDDRRWQFAYVGVPSFEVIEIDDGDSPFAVDDDGIIRLDLSGGDIILTLPAVETGRQYILEITAQAGGAGNDITLDPAAGDSVDVGAADANRTISGPTVGDAFFLIAGTTASDNWRSHGPIAQASIA